ncbi:hypothetical protein HDV00_012784 [Rhizophlyctis rosea]|nr:hypothetical protein HDV00_012784 [Rhizophlyctis rosea]
MRDLSDQLYLAWKGEMAKRITDLDFEGFISKDDVRVQSSAWRLPNEGVRRALYKLQEDLDILGYEYDFRFEHVSDTDWVLFYAIELPERDEDGLSDDDDEEEGLTVNPSSIPADIPGERASEAIKGIGEILTDLKIARDLENLQIRVPKQWHETEQHGEQPEHEHEHLGDTRNKVIFLDH